jgi:plasmid stability protein
MLKCMSKTLQVRNVPEAVHRTLKARAASEGLSLSDYVLRELERMARRPSRSEMYERLRSREPVELDVSPAEVIAAERLAR